MAPSTPARGPARWLAALLATSSVLPAAHAQYYKIDTPGNCFAVEGFHGVGLTR
jgi:hypothetical protein